MFFDFIKQNKKKLLILIVIIFLVFLTSYKLKLLVIATSENPDEESSYVEGKSENTSLSSSSDKIETDNQENQSETQVNEIENSKIEENKNSNISNENKENSNVTNKKTDKLTYSNSDYKVTVSEISKNSLNGIKEVKVVPILKENEETKFNGLTYSEISKKIENKIQEDNTKNNTQNELAGFLAYDIKLIDQNGKEKEPDGNVNVSFEYLKVPDSIKNVDDSKISVIHFEDTNLKEYTSNEKNQSQKLKLEKNKENEITKFELQTNSFSTFTITWREARTNYAQIVFHYINSHGHEINGNQPQNRNVNVTTNSEISISDYANNEITSNGITYEFQGAHYDKIGGTEFTKMTFEVGSNAINPNTTRIRNVTFYNNNQEVANLDYDTTTGNTRVVDVYLVYVYKIDNVSITDTIMQDGCLNAVLKDTKGNTIEDKTGYYFNWYKTTETNQNQPVNWKKVDQKIAGEKYILSDDGSSVNVALDQGANAYYKVVLLNKEGNEVSSEGYHVQYYNDVRNGGFEKPVVPSDSGAYYQFKNDATDLIWKTTGMGTGGKKDKDIEILNEKNKPNPTTDTMRKLYNISEVAEGDQCAELNCEASGALYQDVLTMPGQNLSWSLAHRGRDKLDAGLTDNLDSMYVIIMPTEMAELYDVTTQDKVNYIISHSTKKQNEEYTYEFNGHDIYIKKISDSNRKWNYYKGNFTIPETQYLTRFFFVAGETASGNQTIGNFIDDIHVGQNIDTKIPGYATVNVTKRVKGVPQNRVLNDYNITIKNINGEDDSKQNKSQNDIKDITKSISSSAYSWDSTNGCWTQTVQYIVDLRHLDSVISSFKESNFETLNGYDYVKSEYDFSNVTSENATEQKHGTGSEVSNLNLKEENTYSLIFTNTYNMQVASIKIEKLGKEYVGTNEYTKNLKGAGFTITDVNDQTSRETAQTGDNGIVDVSDLKFDTIYKLEETTTPEGHYNLNSCIYFKVNRDSTVSIIDENGNPKNYDLVSLNNNNIQIINISHTIMPKAGGIGVTPYKIIGITILAISIVGYLILKKKREC